MENSSHLFPRSNEAKRFTAHSFLWHRDAKLLENLFFPSPIFHYFYERRSLLAVLGVLRLGLLLKSRVGDCFFRQKICNVHKIRNTLPVQGAVIDTSDPQKRRCQRTYFDTLSPFPYLLKRRITHCLVAAIIHY